MTLSRIYRFSISENFNFVSLGGEYLQFVYHVWRHISAFSHILWWALLRNHTRSSDFWQPLFNGWVWKTVFWWNFVCWRYVSLQRMKFFSIRRRKFFSDNAGLRRFEWRFRLVDTCARKFKSEQQPIRDSALISAELRHQNGIFCV